MSDQYAAAVHEASHACIAHALGIRFARNAIGIDGECGYVRPHRIDDHRSTTLIAFSLAGGMAEYRAVGTAGVGRGDGSNVGDDDEGDDVFRILETLAEKEGFCGYPRERSLSIDLRAAVKAICESGPYSGRPEFVDIMAKSADIARRILNERWDTVVALANHLLEVRKMSGRELTTFLNERAEMLVPQLQAVELPTQEAQAVEAAEAAV